MTVTNTVTFAICIQLGATGIVGSNINDAKEIVQSLVEDISSGVVVESMSPPEAEGDPTRLLPEIRQSSVVTWDKVRLRRDHNRCS